MSAYIPVTSSASTCNYQAAIMAPSATAAVLLTARILRNSDMRSTSTLAGAAKAVTRFLFEGVQLPKFLSIYAGFFTGLVTGAAGGCALHFFLKRNKCDRAKVKLAVYHILHVIQSSPQYPDLLWNPQELLKHVEAEVMRLVDMHLTMNEAVQVAKAIKRSHVQVPAEDTARKRVRQDAVDVAEKGRGPQLASAYEESPHGFLKEAITEQPQDDREQPERIDTRKHYFGTTDVPSYGSPVKLKANHKVDDPLDIDEPDTLPPIPHVPSHLSGGAGNSMPAVAKEDDGNESEVDSMSSPDATEWATHGAGVPQKASNGSPPYRHTPEFGSFGLDYEDSDLYSSESSSDEQVPPASHPPPVMRRLRGKKCSGTTLSPITSSPAITKRQQTSLPFAHWSTTGELEYSSSESGSEGDAVGPPAASATLHRSASGSPAPSVANSPTLEDNSASPEDTKALRTPEPVVKQETVPPSSPSRKRKSPSSSPSSTPKRTQTSSTWADITSGKTSQTPPAALSSYNKLPFKVGRGRGRTGPGPVVRSTASAPPAVLETPKVKKVEKSGKTPATRKSVRLEEMGRTSRR